MPPRDGPRVNEDIRVPQVRLIDQDGEMIGVLSRDDALRAAEESEFVASVLGEHVFDALLRNKRQEWDDYRVEVTPYELRRYLSGL